MSRIAANAEGANALRKLANDIPAAFNTLSEATNHLDSVMNSMASSLGVHYNDMKDLITQNVKNALKIASDSVQGLPVQLNNTAQKIDAYVSRKMGK